ncbi:hypothetical protein Tdes44962_MAKER01549 [Teratosphaeria destructans]|uniref:Uncharacterized protein n=1 Tax=Teratosphaeria destructans TaxID=418781 RepID=A0A9W7SZ24_9PEZI|nr:hypothetical protein Tdes44962_MAKER01549 [Teratosphaeria destructans]
MPEGPQKFRGNSRRSAKQHVAAWNCQLESYAIGEDIVAAPQGGSQVAEELDHRKRPQPERC